MRRLITLCCLTLVILTACQDDKDDPYPSVITDMADLYTNSTGTMSRLALDDGTVYNIADGKDNYHANSIYRVLAGYTKNSDNTITMQTLTGAYFLRDSTIQSKTDPTKVLSVWRTQRYINLHLAPLTKNYLQYWGFITDSVTTETATDGSTTHHAYISLHHNQNGDPTGFTKDVYASILLDSIKYTGADGKRVSIDRATTPITLRINTFDGVYQRQL